jgi:hypothetical protein
MGVELYIVTIYGVSSQAFGVWISETTIAPRLG